MLMAKNARQEIEDFLQSPFLGMSTDFSKSKLERAAETMFIANGINSPVRVVAQNGQTYLIKQSAITDTTTNG